MILELECQQGYRYCVIYKGKDLTVTKQELIELIKNTPANCRNCKVSNNNTISMKAGYGKLTKC